MSSIPMPAREPALPAMGFGEAISACFSKYASFTGRARRAEYWYWTLFTLLLQFGLGFALGLAHAGGVANSLPALVSLLLLLPALAVTVRRLHDTDHSGWWWFIWLTGIGAIVLLVWFCQEGTKGPNRFGPRTT
jgi:uncharacterized membrane protein YhaH (DUF805 family)